MSMRASRPWRQRGDALVVAIVAMLIFHVVAYVMMQWARTVKEARFYASESIGLLQVQRAVTQYAKANQASFKANFVGDKAIMYVVNERAPTIAELQSLGFLSASGPEVSAPWGSTFATTLALQPSGAITGAVYLNGSIRDLAGAPDRIHACNVARALGNIGLCTPPNNAAVLGNLNTQIANPSGAPGAVGALVSIPP